MAMQFNIGEAKNRLSQLVAAAMRGEDVVLRRAGVPQVRLVPVDRCETDEREALKNKLLAVRGSFKGRFDPNIDWEVPSMTEAEVAVWEDDQVKRFYESP